MTSVPVEPPDNSRGGIRLRHVLIALAVVAAATAAFAPQPRVSLIAGDLSISLALAAIVSTVRHVRREARARAAG